MLHPSLLLDWKVLVVSDSLVFMVCSLPGSSVHGLSQARILEWEPFPSPGDLLHSGVKAGSPALKADSLPSESRGKINYVLSIFTILQSGSACCY